MAVVNYGFHDIFSLADIHWVGVEWFADILGSDRFLASLGRSLLLAALVLAIQIPLGLMIARFLIGCGRGAVWGLMLLVILHAVLSWVPTRSPITGLLALLAEPLLAPIRRLLPAMGGVDLSPLIVLVLLQVCLIVLGNLQRGALF